MKKKAMALFLVMLIVCLPLAIADISDIEEGLEETKILEDVELDIPDLSSLEFEEPEEGEFEEWETGESIIVDVKKYEPAILRSSWIEDGDVPVYAFLSGKTLGSMLGTTSAVEPLYSQPEIKYMRVKPLDEDTRDYVRGMPRLIRPKGKSTLENLGTMLVMLRQIELEEEVPGSIELNMEAIIEFENAERLFTTFQQDLVIPEDRDEDIWKTKNLYDYSFFSGRGFVRASEINDDGVRLTVYASEAHLGLNQLIPTFAGKAISVIENFIGAQVFSPTLAPRPIRSILLKRGETSNHIRLTTASDLAQNQFRVKLVDVIDAMDKRVRLRLAMDGKIQEIVVTEGSPLYPGSRWRVDSIITVTNPQTGEVRYEVTLRSGSEIVKVEKTEKGAAGDVDPCESAEVLLKGLKLPGRIAEDEWKLVYDKTITVDIVENDIVNLNDLSLKHSLMDGDDNQAAGHYLRLEDVFGEYSTVLLGTFFNLKKKLQAQYMSEPSDEMVSQGYYNYDDLEMYKDTKETIIKDDDKYEITYLEYTDAKDSQKVKLHIVRYSKGVVEEVAEKTTTKSLTGKTTVKFDYTQEHLLNLDDFTAYASSSLPTLADGNYLWIAEADETSMRFQSFVLPDDRALPTPVSMMLGEGDEPVENPEYTLKLTAPAVAVAGRDPITIDTPGKQDVLLYAGLDRETGEAVINAASYKIEQEDVSEAVKTAATKDLKNKATVRDAGSYECVQTKKSDLYERGSVTIYDDAQKRTISSYTDTCVGDTLEEYYCSGKIVMKGTKDCEYGCENGKCREAEGALTAKVAATIAIPDTLPADQVAELLTNTPQEAVYCTAIKELKKVIDDHPGVNDKFGVPYGAKAAFQIAEIYDDLGYPKMAVEYYLKSLQAGKGDFAEEAFRKAEILMDDAQSGATYKSVSINDNGREVSVQLRDVLGVSDEDKPSAKIDVEGDGLKTLKPGDKVFSQDFATSKDGKAYSYNWRIKRITSADVYIEKYVTEGSADIGGLTSRIFGTNIERLPLKEHTQVDGKDLYVREIDLKKSVLLRIIPGTGESLRSRSNFTMHITVDKRAVQWTPSEIDRKINKTEAVIGKLDKAIGRMDKMLKVWKKTCLVTFAYLTLKNSLFSGSSRTLARRVAMRGFDGTSGWSAYCASNSGRGLQYKTYEDCLAKNTDEISKTIDDTQQAVDQVNREMKNYQHQDWFLEMNDNYTSLDKFGDVAEGELYTPETLRDYRFWQLMGQSQSYSSLSGEQGNYNFQTEVNDHLEEFNIGGSQVAYNKAVKAIEEKYPDYDELPLDERKKVFDDLYKLGMMEQEDVKSEEFAYIKNLGINSLEIIRPAEKGFVANTLDGSMGLDVAYGQDYKEVLQNEVAILREKAAAAENDALKNEYETHIDNYNKEIERIEKNPMAPLTSSQGQVYKTTSGEKKFFVGPKGFTSGELNTEYAPGATVEFYPDGKPYCIPTCNGNYVRVLEFFADGTPKTVQEWNVGPDGLMCNGDDEMTMHHSVLTLPENEAKYRELVSRATRSGYKQSGETYGACGSSFLVSTNRASHFQQMNNPGCYDVMDPGDCQTLFGVCDPVMCPASRFNLGGEWPVENVVQTGLIGSLVLGLHNFNMPKEPVPVCLTGVKAGLENIRSILQGYVGCLKTAKVHGKSVGVCDKIRSIFICETLWREAMAIVQIRGGIFRWIGKKIMGESATGGGEYLTFQTSMENVGDSVRFFTKEYATTAFSAFNARSTEEIGATVCKNAIYRKLPDFGEMFNQLATPESPPQYTAFMNIIPLSETMQKSMYEVYYHIYAGENQQVDYSVYLKDPFGDRFYITEECEGRRGSIEKGGLADFALECPAKAGFNEVCVNVNGREECGFGKVSSSFAIDALNDMIVDDESKRNISSEFDCVPTVSRTSPSLGSLVLPGEAGLVSTGVVRVCSIRNPGEGVNENNWKVVGTCGMDKSGRSLGNCWISFDSVNINHLGMRADLIDELDEQTLRSIKEELGYTGLLGSDEARAELERIHGMAEDTCSQLVDKYRAYRGLATVSLSPQVAAEAQYYAGLMLIELAKKDGCTLVDPLRPLNTLIVFMKRELDSLVNEYMAEVTNIEGQKIWGSKMREALEENRDAFLERLDGVEKDFIARAESTIKEKGLPEGALESFKAYIAVDVKTAREKIVGELGVGIEEVTESKIQLHGVLCHQCGKGTFGGGITNICDREECYSLNNGLCFFVDGKATNVLSTGAVFNDCEPCVLAAKEGCSAINDEAKCQPDNPCVKAAGLSCEWSTLGGGRCVTSKGVDKDVEKKDSLCMDECEDWSGWCTQDECHSIGSDCFYYKNTQGFFTKLAISDDECHSCSWATSCFDLNDDKQMCQNPGCTQQFNMYCKWDDARDECVKTLEPVTTAEGGTSGIVAYSKCFIDNGFKDIDGNPVQDFTCMDYDEDVDYKLNTVLINLLKGKKKVAPDERWVIVSTLDKYAKKYDINPYLIASFIEVECPAWDKNCDNGAGDYGIMQCRNNPEAKGDLEEGFRCGVSIMASTVHGKICGTTGLKAETFTQLKTAYTAGQGYKCKNIAEMQRVNSDFSKVDFDNVVNINQKILDRWTKNWPRSLEKLKGWWEEAGLMEYRTVSTGGVVGGASGGVSGGAGYKFAVAGDFHFGPKGVVSYMDDAVDKIIEESPDFLIITGDMVGTYSGNVNTAPDAWENFIENFFNPIREAGIKMVPVRGNHDSFDPKVLAGYTGLWGAYNTGFAVSGSYPTYYSFDYKGDHFAVIEDSRTTQKSVVDWLEEDLEEAETEGAARIFVMGHRPVDNLRPCQKEGGQIVFPTSERTRLKEMLAENDAIYIHGHIHGPAIGNNDGVNYIDPGALTRRDGILGQSTCKIEGDKWSPNPMPPPTFAVVDTSKGAVTFYDGSDGDFDDVYDVPLVSGQAKYLKDGVVKTRSISHEEFDYSLIQSTGGTSSTSTGGSGAQVVYYTLNRYDKTYRVIKIDYTKTDLKVMTAKAISGNDRMLVEDACDAVSGCLAMTNAGFPGTEGGILIEDGSRVPGYNFRDEKAGLNVEKGWTGILDAVFYVRNGVPKISPIADFRSLYKSDARSEIESALQLGPMLIENGKINTEQRTDPDYKFYSRNDKRNVIGVECNGPYMIILNRKHTPTLDSPCLRSDNMYTEMAPILRDDFGCKYAMSLDGGGSVSVAVPLMNVAAHDCLAKSGTNDPAPPRAVLNFIAAVDKSAGSSASSSYTTEIGGMKE